MLIVVAIMGGLAAASTFMIIPQISHFKGRGAAEQLVAALRKAASLARSRKVGGSSGRYGVHIFAGRTPVDRDPASPALTTGYSFVLYATSQGIDASGDFNDLDRNLDEVAVPVTPGGLDDPDNKNLWAEVVNLDESVELQGDSEAALSGEQRFEFNGMGELDETNSDVTGLIAESRNIGGGETRNDYSFDVVNENMGYYRIRVRWNGTIEISALVDDLVTSPRVPYSLDFNGNQVTF